MLPKIDQENNTVIPARTERKTARIVFPPVISRMQEIIGPVAHNTPVTPNATAVLHPKTSEKIMPKAP